MGYTDGLGHPYREGNADWAPVLSGKVQLVRHEAVAIDAFYDGRALMVEVQRELYH